MPELKDIISIAGQPGLYQIIGKRTNGLIVESIDQQKRRFPTSVTQKISVLEDISIYTYDGDVKILEVFRSLRDLEQTGHALVSKKDKPETVKEFFRKVMPEYDERRVYVSDMVKIVQWYVILKDMISLEKESVETDASSDTEASPKKTAKKKKTDSEQNG